MKRLWPIYISIAFIAAFSLINTYKWLNYEERTYFQFSSDIGGYYSFLPALFLNHDLFFERTTQPDTYFDLRYGDRKSTKYPIGMAIMYSPFFLAASYADDGKSANSQYGVSKTYSRFIRFGNVFYFLAGLYFLTLLMTRFFTPLIVSVTILTLFFGTNLCYYVVAEGELPHNYLFALFSILLYLIHRWWNEGKSWQLYLIALISGLSIIIRASEITFLMVPLLWGIRNFNQLAGRISILAKDVRTYIALVIFLIPISLQIAYWYNLSGSLLIWNYTDQVFFFGQPKIFDFLFSFRKGWFTYSPIMLFAIAGFFLLRRKTPDLMIAAPLLIVVNIYILSSWWCWWFGGSYGSRAMIQYYSILAFPLAATFDALRKRLMFAMPALLIIAVLIHQNHLFMFRYQITWLHWDSMTKESFIYNWKRLVLDGKDYPNYQKLLKAPDYKGAKKGVNR